MMKVIEDPEAVEKLKSSGDKEKNLEILRSEYNVRDSWVHGEHHRVLLTIRFPRTRSMRYTTLGSANTRSVTTQQPPTSCTISSSSPPLSNSTFPPTGVNSLPISFPENGNQPHPK